MRTIVLNSTNCVPTTTSSGVDNSNFVYTFPISAQFQDEEIAVSAISLYYSWFSITSALGNNTFTYTWYNAAGAVGPFTITVPDGFYTIAQLNAYLQSVMISNSHYLITASGQYVYYLEFVENASRYSIQFNSYAIPTAATAAALGYTTPAGWVSFPAAAITPQITIATNAFRDIVGFNAGTYPNPTQATNYSKISDFTPQVSPVQSILVSCSLVSNPLAIPNNIIYSLTPNVEFGSLITPNISNMIWNETLNGYFTSFKIQFLDQSFNPLLLRDTNLVIVLSVRKKPKFNGND